MISIFIECTFSFPRTKYRKMKCQHFTQSQVLISHAFALTATSETVSDDSSEIVARIDRS